MTEDLILKKSSRFYNFRNKKHRMYKFYSHERLLRARTTLTGI